MADADRAKGNERFTAGKYAEAIEWYSKAIEKDPTSEVPHSNRAAAYSALSRHEEALKDAETCIRLKPEWVKGHFRLGIALLGLSRYEGAVAAFTRALELTGNTDPEMQARLNEARACLKAEAASKTVAGVTDPREAKRLGNMHFKDSAYTDAAKWYSRAIELATARPGLIAEEELAVYYTNRAACHSQTHSYKEVVADCTDAIRLHPRSAKAYLRRAIAHEGLEKWAAAADDYRKVMELEPGAANASTGYQRCIKHARAS